VIFLSNSKSKMLYNTQTQTFNFWDTCDSQMAQGVKWSNNGYLIVTHTIGIEDSHLETGVHSASSSMDPTDHLEIFQGPLVGIVSVLVQCCITLSTSLIPQLPFWHLHWLVFGESVDDLYSQMLGVTLHISWRCYCICQNTAASLWHWPGIWIVQFYAAVSAIITAPSIKGMQQYWAVHIPWSFDHSLVLPYTVCSTLNNACHCYDK